MKKLRILLTIVCILCLVGCSSKQEISQKTFVSEEEIVSAKVEYRTRTTRFGGIRGYNPYLIIMFIEEDGSLNVEDHQIREDYTEFNYELHVTKGDENKIIRYEQGQKGIFEVYLTEQIYERIFNEMDS